MFLCFLIWVWPAHEQQGRLNLRQSADRKRGQRKGATPKKPQIGKTYFRMFRQISRNIVKNRQKINRVQTRCIVKTRGFTRGVCVQICDFIKLKGFFSCGIPREQALLRKSKKPRKSPEMWIFLSLAFCNGFRVAPIVWPFLGASSSEAKPSKLFWPAPV